MTEMKKLTDQVVQKLVELGYSVHSQTWTARGNRIRVNIYGWGTGSSGDIVPLVAVEAMEKAEPDEINLALQQLNSVQSVMNTCEHYIFDGQTWWKASEDFRSVNVSAPPNRIKASTKKITDKKIIAPLIKKELHKELEITRGRLSIQDGIAAAVGNILHTLINLGEAIALSGNATLPIERQAFVKALQLNLIQMTGREAQYLTPPDLVEFLFNLVGDLPDIESFYDPFAGSGANTREAWMRYGLKTEQQIQILGREINGSVVELADALNSASGSNITMELGNSFLLPKAIADLVVTIPPLGVRLNDPFETPFGLTKNGDIAAISLTVTSLKPNGVAAMITPPGWTWSSEGQALRDWLSQEYHVLALLSLPPVLKHLTAISPIALLVRNSIPGETVVGSLKEDWLEQSSKNQELVQAVNKLLKDHSHD
jgi:hypothetical protein